MIVAFWKIREAYSEPDSGRLYYDKSFKAQDSSVCKKLETDISVTISMQIRGTKPTFHIPQGETELGRVRPFVQKSRLQISEHILVQ